MDFTAIGVIILNFKTARDLPTLKLNCFKVKIT